MGGYTHHVACITQNNLTWYSWRGRRSSSLRFKADSVGLEQFRQWLDDLDHHPVDVLVDIVEEEFKTESVPRVFGRDRAQILQRRAKRLFRDTDYRWARVEGADPGNKGQLRILVSAISNSARLDIWLDALYERGMPVSRIVSVPLISERLVKYLGAPMDNALLVTFQRKGRLRVTYIRDGYCFVSYVTTLSEHGSRAPGDYVVDEIHRSRFYLENTLRALNVDTRLDVVVLATREWLKHFAAPKQDRGLFAYHLFDLAEVSQGLKLHNMDHSAGTMQFFSELTCKWRPENQYARGNSLYFSRLHKARRLIQASAAAIAAGTLAWSSHNILAGMEIQRSMEGLPAQQQQTMREIAQVKAQLGPTPMAPADMAAAVRLAQRATDMRREPRSLLRAFSDVLQDYPRISLEQLSWRAHEAVRIENDIAAADPVAAAQAQSTADRLEHRLPGATPQRQAPARSVLEVYGWVDDETLALREIVYLLNQFRKRLAGQGQISRAELTELPVKIASGAVASGAAGQAAQNKRPWFRMRLWSAG